MKKVIVIFVIFILGILSGIYIYNMVFLSENSHEGINNKLLLNTIKGGDSKNFLNEVEKYNIGEKKISKEIKTVFSNINYYLENNKNDRIDKVSLKNQTYSTVGNILLFKFIKDVKECDTISKNYFILDKEYFKKDCKFNLYLKNQLSKGDNNIPLDTKKYNSIFGMLENNNCTYRNFTCYLLGNDKSFVDFTKYMNGFTKLENISTIITQIGLVNYGFYNYIGNIKYINESNLINFFYDNALLYKYIKEKDIQICNEMKNEENIIFCKDFYNESKNKYYKDLFEQFFIKLYLQEKNV